METGCNIERQNESAPVAIGDKYARALSEVNSMFMDMGMPTFDMVPIVERELERLRRPHQNPEDNEA